MSKPVEKTQKMADNRPSIRRVSKPRGPYNQFLRREFPLEHVPRSSKRLLLSAAHGPEAGKRLRQTRYQKRRIFSSSYNFNGTLVVIYIL